MALNKDKLESDLSNVFSSMTSGDNSVFSNGISNAVVTFVSGGVVTTTDSGTVSAGVFAGSGSGSITVTATACAKIIKDACDTMVNMTSGGDVFLAQEIGKGIKKMADDAVVITSVKGTATAGTTTTTLSGTAKGTITCTEAPLVSALQTLFAKMLSNKEVEGYDGNADFAKELANAVDTFYTGGQVKTDGQIALSGAKGIGTVA